MHFLRELSRNYVLICAGLGYTVAQLFKLIIAIFKEKRFRPGLMISSGGMPSSHATTVTATAVAVGRIYGVSSGLFAIAFVLAAIVMYDACNVRRSAGDTARLVNQLLAHVEKLTAEDFAEDLKEVMGHTPLQVLMGALLGLAVGLLV